MMYPETNFNYDSNNENKEIESREDKISQEEICTKQQQFLQVLQLLAEASGADHF